MYLSSVPSLNKCRFHRSAGETCIAQELLLDLLLGVAGLEAGHAAAGVEDLLLARVEGVAVGADLGVDDPARRGAARRERVAAGAGDLGQHVLGVDVLLHVFLSLSAAGSHGSVREPEPASKCAIADRTEANRLAP